MPDEDDQTSDDQQETGAPTKETLDAEALARQAANKKAANVRAAAERDKLKLQLAELKAELQKFKPEDEVNPKAIAEAAKAEVRAEILKDRALDKIEVLAAKAFANPALAAKLLASDVDSFVNDGKVDTEAINDALKDLLEAEPYLAAAPAKRFQGTADQGTRGNGKANDLDAQIAAAAAKGDVMAQIRLQNQKILPLVQRMQGIQP